MKAVFFDRDGVLNKELGKYVTHADELEVNAWVIPFMQTLKEAGYSFFVVTNQGGIARQLYTESDLFGIHTKLLKTLGEHGLKFTEVFYCPHHPVTTHCLCRKPDNLMLEKAIAKYGVNISQSFMLGDSDRDVEAAKKTGLTVFKILSNNPPELLQLQEIQQIASTRFPPF